MRLKVTTTTNKVGKTLLKNPQNSPFHQQSDRSFGAFLGAAIYPQYKHKKHASNYYDLAVNTITSGNINYTADYHILVFGGNAMLAGETLGMGFSEIAQENNINIHVIEMPGVTENSKGVIQNHSHCIKAAILQVEYLLAQGVDPEKIILYGLSLGGAISTIAAAHLHSQGKKVSVFNDRSFSTVSATVNGMIVYPIFKNFATPLVGVASLGYNLYHGSLLSSSALKPFAYVLAAYLFINSAVKIALRATHWEMNAGNAYLSIPTYYKKLAYAVNDCVITNLGGLYQVAQSSTEANRIHSYKTTEPNNHAASPYDMHRDNRITTIAEKISSCL